MSRSLKRLIKQSKKLFAKKRHYPSRANISRYAKLQSRIQKMSRQGYWKYINSILLPENKSQDDGGTKRFWTYIKHCKADSVGVAPLLNKTTGERTTDPKEKANILNGQFKSVFSLNVPQKLAHICKDKIRNMPQENIPPNLRQKYQTMPAFDISTNGILKLLGTLKPHKASGPDRIRPLVLKEMRESVAPILQMIFTKSIHSGEVPLDWKTANVVPIYKKGPKHLPVNYRPVSLTSICSKIMEHILASQITRHLNTHGILDKNQHGFRPGLSCDTQLIEFVQDLHSTMKGGKQVDAVVMDFSKAFDKVPHNRLIYKLREYGIDDRTTAWIEHWLSGRSQQVVIEGVTSDTVSVTSGVPQGSVLGPILFLIFINDISKDITSTVRLFADDTIIYRSISSDADCAILQKDLNALDAWSVEWQMEFHPSKCNVIHITRARRPRETSYSIYGTALASVSSVKYLGVEITPDVRWNKHIRSTRNKASGTLSFLQRNLRISSTEVKTRAYQSFVRPRLEFASAVWDPHTKANIDCIEMVQRRAARWVLGRYHNKSSVTDMLAHLGWRSLQLRRIDTRLTMLYKMRNGLVSLDTSSYLIPMTGIASSAQPHKYLVPPTKTQVHQYSFFPRTISVWNRLPHEVAMAPTLDAFKGIVGQMQHTA